MKLLLSLLSLLCLFLMSACSQSSSGFTLSHPDDSTTLIHIPQPKRYLLLPIEEEQPEVLLRLRDDSLKMPYMDVRLAVTRVDYYVPLELPAGRAAEVEVVGLSKEALCWQRLSLSDSLPEQPSDTYRAPDHFAPRYGWMNDPNGLIYHEGKYHLYYQYNPYGAKWGNMHWGHATTTDFLHWQEHQPALRRDTLGHIFSGSAICDTLGVAGFGKGALLAFYTAHQFVGEKQWQAQCLAYSTDGGQSYTKYRGNPILTAADGVQDFRDPKVFWYAPRRSWYMIVSADKEMRFYRSADLKHWDYVSAFGEGYGARPNQFECPDFFELRDPHTGCSRWVMIVNINPGGAFGGSATEYFVGDFDGERFVPDSAPEVTRWLDFGKDHYAFVTFSGLRDRVLGLPWVSNWQYADVTPFRTTRGAMGFPRELFLFASGGRSYVGARPARELLQRRGQAQDLKRADAMRDSLLLSDQLASLGDRYELVLRLAPQPGVQRCGLMLSNAEGDRLPVYLDLERGRVVMDRTRSGLVNFGLKAKSHERESGDWRKDETLNYHNDFALATWAPLSLVSGPSYELRLFLDRSIAELFVADGRIAMTNLVFPRAPYSTLQLFSEGGETKLLEATLYPRK